MKRWMPDLHSLSAQMILSLVALALLTATAAGLPAIWLIREQFGRQAWAQVEQGSLAAQALYLAKQNELASLATLTAQRPTLREMLNQREQDALPAYLHTLQEGSQLDLVLVCDSGQVLSPATCVPSRTLAACILFRGIPLPRRGFWPPMLLMARHFVPWLWVWPWMTGLPCRCETRLAWSTRCWWTDKRWQLA
jgi:hypothetical protein